MTTKKSDRRQWLIYGATGYTGTHIAELAIAKGFCPVLAGRNEKSIRQLAERLGLEWRSADLGNAAALKSMAAEFSVVLNVAGPFIHTWQPMVEACLAAGTHYLDLTGEIPIFEGLAALDQRARDAGVMLMPGVGFDMVPGDCLALALKRLMPDAISLDMAVSFEGTLTHGSILSALLMQTETLVRRDHQLVPLDQRLAREFDFGPGRCGGRVRSRALTFGDISVAWRTTGIPNITSYQRPVKEWAQMLAAIKTPADVAALPSGPTAEELATIPTIFVGEVRNSAGDVRAMRLVTPQSYAITFELATAIAQRVNDGDFRRGYQTPASVYGEDFILEFDGCHREMWPPG